MIEVLMKTIPGRGIVWVCYVEGEAVYTGDKGVAEHVAEQFRRQRCKRA